MDWRQLIPRGFMVVNPMWFMGDLNWWMVPAFLPMWLTLCCPFFMLARWFHVKVHLSTGLPPLVLRRVLEILTYLATHHSAVASILFHFDLSLVPDYSNSNHQEITKDKGKGKVEGEDLSNLSLNFRRLDIPLILFLKLLSQPLFVRSSAHLEQVGHIFQPCKYMAEQKKKKKNL